MKGGGQGYWTKALFKKLDDRGQVLALELGTGTCKK